MYYFLLSLHSLVRWFVLFSLLFSLFMALRGVIRKSVFTPFANAVRHWTATTAHIQLMIGATLYVHSPVIKNATVGSGALINSGTFFRYLHLALMVIAIVLITIGSAKAKRMTTDLEKYHTMLRWYSSGVVVIFLAIPWPFYELVARPLIRNF